MNTRRYLDDPHAAGVSKTWLKVVLVLVITSPMRVAADVEDAGVPLSAGTAAASQSIPLVDLADDCLGSAYQDAQLAGDRTRANAIEQQIEERLGPGTWGPPGATPRLPANTMVRPDIALKLLDNMAQGQPPFAPEFGKGRASWFVLKGAPYTGVDASKTIRVKVDLSFPKDRIVFREPLLLSMLETATQTTEAEAEAEFRRRFGIDQNARLSNRLRKSLARFQRHFAESRMWDAVGEQVNANSTGVGEVILESGSRFSRTPGTFGVVADASKVRLHGGVNGLLTTLNQQGVGASPVVVEAAEALAHKMQWAGRVRSVFHHGGRVLVVVAVTADVLKIYRAANKQKAIITSAAGWAGAVGASATFAAWFAPADTGGPWAWAAHGVGTLVSGGVGYWLGSETTRTVYELAAE